MKKREENTSIWNPNGIWMNGIPSFFFVELCKKVIGYGEGPFGVSDGPFPSGREREREKMTLLDRMRLNN